MSLVFTPGPWLCDGSWISASFTPGQPMIAHTVSESYRSAEEADGNRKLLSAAPELYIALREVVDLCKCEAQFCKRSPVREAIGLLKRLESDK